MNKRTKKNNIFPKFPLIFAVIFLCFISSLPQIWHWRDITTLEVVSIQGNVPLTGNGNFRVDEEPEFRIRIPKEVAAKIPVKRNLANLFGLFGAQTVNAEEMNAFNMKSEITDYENQKTDIEPLTEFIDGEVKVTVPKVENQFRPGKYRLKVEMMDGDRVFTGARDFTWGVLAINLNSSSYHTEESVSIGMAALNDKGKTLCDANLTLRITDPQNQTTTFATSDSGIKVSDTCANGNVTDVSDYATRYVPKLPGQYKVNLQAETINGSRSMNESFEVLENPDFVISREGTSMRIVPTHDYTVRVDILANKDVVAGEIREIVPASFGINNISAGGKIVEKDDVSKTIAWPISTKTGEHTKISYDYDAPDISPEFYLLGPIEIWENAAKSKNAKSNSAIIFSEPRQWQIASDAIACNSAGTGAWATAATWAAPCNVAGGPTAANDVTILTAHIITAGATAAAATITLNDPATANGLIISSTFTVNVTGDVTYNANTTANNQTITLSGTGILNVGGNLVMDNALTGAGSHLVISNGTVACTTCKLQVTGATRMTNATTAVAGASKITLTSGTTNLFSTGTLAITGDTNGTGITTVSTASGTITVSGTTTPIAFTGDAAHTLINITGAGTLNLSGDLPAGGTVTLAGTSTTNLNATLAINGAYTFGIFKVLTGTTTIGAAITCAGAITVSNGTTLTLGDFPFTASTTTTIGSGTSGIMNVAGAGSNGTYAFNGNITVAANGIFDLNNGTHAITFGGTSYSHSGRAFNTGAGAITAISTGAMALTGSANMTIGGTFTVPTNRTITNSNSATVTIAALTLANPATANGYVVGTGSTTTVTGNVTFDTNTAATAINQTITMQGTGILNVGGDLVMDNPPTGLGSPLIVSTSATVCTSCKVQVTGATHLANSAGAFSGVAKITMTTGTTNLFSTNTLAFTTTTTGTGQATLSTAGTITISSTTTPISYTGPTPARMFISVAATGTLNLYDDLPAGGVTTMTAGSTVNMNSTLTVAQAVTFSKCNIVAGTTTLGAITTCGQAVTVADGATLSLGNFAFTAGTTVTIGTGTSGILNVAGAGNTGTHTFTGNVTVNTGGRFDLSAGTHATSWGGTAYTNYGTFITAGTGTMTISGTGNMAFAGSSSMTWSAPTMTIPTNKTVTNSNTATVNINALTLASPTAANGFIAGDLSTTTVAGAITFSANSTANNQTITLQGSGILNGGSLVMNNTHGAAGLSQVITTSATPCTSCQLRITGATSLSNATTALLGAASINMTTGATNLFSTGTLSITGNTLGTTVTTVSTATGTITIGGAVTFAGVAAKTLLSVTDTGTLNLSGNLPTAGTVTMATASTTNTNASLTIGGAYTFGIFKVLIGTTTQGAALIATGSTSIASGATLNSSTYTYEARGNYFNSGIHSGSVGGITVSGASSMIGGENGSITNTGTFVISGATAPSVVAGSSLTFSHTVSVTTALTNNGTITLNDATSSLIGLGNWTNASGSTLNILSAATITTLTPAAAANTINYTGTAQTVDDPATNPYWNLGFSGSGVNTIALPASVTSLAGNLALSGTANVTTGANITNIAGNVTIATGSKLTIPAYTFTVTGNTTVDSGGQIIFNSSTNPLKTFTGNVTINGTWNETADITTSFGGNFTNNATSFTAGAGEHSFDGAGTVMSGTTTSEIPNMRIGAAVSNSGTITASTIFNVGGSGVFTNNNMVTAATSLTGSGEFINASGSRLDIAGTVDITTLTASASTNTVNYTVAAGAQTIYATTYNNLTLGNTSGSNVAGGAIASNGTFTTFAGGTCNMGTYDLSVATVSHSGILKTQSLSTTPLTTGKTWGGTVEYNDGTGGTQTVMAGSYNNLTAAGGAARTLNFEAGATTNVTGTWTVTGGLGQLITMTSNSSPTKWIVNAASASIDYANISYSNNTGPAFCATHSVGSNNTGWSVTSGTTCNAAPTLSISQPAGAPIVIVGNPYNITYTLADTDDIVTVAFYYDTNNDKTGGVAIAAPCAAAAEGSGVTCAWDTTGVTLGTYYVYGITNDGTNLPVDAVSSGTLTIDAGTISATIDTPTTNYGTMAVNAVKKATTGNADNEFIITNNGDAAEDIDIISSDAVGGSGWTLSTTAIGSSIFMHAYSTLKTLSASSTLGTDPSIEWVPMDKTPNYSTVATNVAASGVVNLVLELLMPSSISDASAKQVTVTIRATAH